MYRFFVYCYLQDPFLVHPYGPQSTRNWTMTSISICIGTTIKSDSVIPVATSGLDSRPCIRWPRLHHTVWESSSRRATIVFGIMRNIRRSRSMRKQTSTPYTWVASLAMAETPCNTTTPTVQLNGSTMACPFHSRYRRMCLGVTELETGLTTVIISSWLDQEPLSMSGVVWRTSLGFPATCCLHHAWWSKLIEGFTF